MSKIRSLGGCIFSIGGLYAFILLYLGICWVVNIFVMFNHCDFSDKSDWSEEVIHLLGVISFVGSGVTVWL